MAQAIPIALTVAGTALSAGSSILGANAEAKQLRAEASQLEYNAGQQRAASQREAIEARRQTRYVASRALAVAAASGGGVDDPTVINNMANIEGEGEYNALMALYNGDQQARGMEQEAVSRRAAAKSTKTAGLLKGASTILSAGSSMFDRFGK